jgi:hypothetical protein
MLTPVPDKSLPAFLLELVSEAFCAVTGDELCQAPVTKSMLANSGVRDTQLFEKLNGGSAQGGVSLNGWLAYFTKEYGAKEGKKAGKGEKWLTELVNTILANQAGSEPNPPQVLPQSNYSTYVHIW